MKARHTVAAAHPRGFLRMGWTAAILAALAAACGGGGAATAPGSPTALDPRSVPAGTVFTVVSGDTDRPVAGASFVLSGRPHTTDAAGQVVLVEDARWGELADITAAGFLDRQTILRSPAETRFTLWPRTTPQGINEQVSAELVYTHGAYCCPAEPGRLAAASLMRMHNGIAVPLGLPPSWRGTPGEAIAQQAVDLVNTANEGRVVFHIADSGTGGVEMAIRPNSYPGPGTATAYFTARLDAEGYITGGELVLSHPDFVLDPQRFNGEVVRWIIAHELGHGLGLQHSTLPMGMMSVDRSWVATDYYRIRSAGFSPAETALLRLAYLRRPGTQFPDNDRSARVGAAARSGSELLCVIPATRPGSFTRPRGLPSG